ncbi:MAG: hypothetical protein ACRD2G_02375 [Terriglobia bacterium]
MNQPSEGVSFLVTAARNAYENAQLDFSLDDLLQRAAQRRGKRSRVIKLSGFAATIAIVVIATLSYGVTTPKVVKRAPAPITHLTVTLDGHAVSPRLPVNVPIGRTITCELISAPGQPFAWKTLRLYERQVVPAPGTESVILAIRVVDAQRRTAQVPSPSHPETVDLILSSAGGAARVSTQVVAAIRFQLAPEKKGK